MLPQFELEPGESIEVEFVEPARYVKHPNQLAAITDRRLLFIKRKLFAKHPYGLESFRRSTWTGLKYRSSFALLPTAAGLILISSAFLTVYYLQTGQLDDGGPGYGTAATMLVMGIPLFFGVKRHRLELTVGSRTLAWRSPALKYDEAFPAVRHVVELAKELKLFVDGAPKDDV